MLSALPSMHDMSIGKGCTARPGVPGRTIADCPEALEVFSVETLKEKESCGCVVEFVAGLYTTPYVSTPV